MFRKMMIAACTVTMFSLGGMTAPQSAEAAPRVFRPVPTPAARRTYRNARQDYQRAARRYDRVGRQFNNRYARPYRMAPHRGAYFGPVPRRGFVNTPYFSIGF